MLRRKSEARREHFFGTNTSDRNAFKQWKKKNKKLHRLCQRRIKEGVSGEANVGLSSNVDSLSLSRSLVLRMKEEEER